MYDERMIKEDCVEMKSMKRAERRHRSRMKRKRKYRLVESLNGVNLRRAPVKVAQMGQPITRGDFDLLFPRHQWLSFRQNEERLYNALTMGEKSEVQAMRAGAVPSRRALKGKPSRKHFDLVEHCLIERVEGAIHARWASSCDCWFHGEPEDGCRNCADFLAHRLKLQLRWYDKVKPKLNRRHVVEAFLKDLLVFVEKYLGE